MTHSIPDAYCPYTRLTQGWLDKSNAHTTDTANPSATPAVRACTNAAIDESGTGQGCGCYLEVKGQVCSIGLLCVLECMVWGV